jgi:hypothetical protein
VADRCAVRQQGQGLGQDGLLAPLLVAQAQLVARARAIGKALMSPACSSRRSAISLSQSAISKAGGAGTATVPDNTTALTLRLRMTSPFQQ